MRREYIFIRHLIWFFFLLYFKHLYVNGKFFLNYKKFYVYVFQIWKPSKLIAEESIDEYSKGCTYLHCESGSRCITRRFWCKNPPCPGMLYCSKSRKGKCQENPLLSEMYIFLSHFYFNICRLSF